MFRTLTITLSPEELARIFCSMEADEQAEFFSWVGDIVENEWSILFDSQLERVYNSNQLTERGKTAMALIGEYSNPYGIE